MLPLNCYEEKMNAVHLSSVIIYELATQNKFPSFLCSILRLCTKFDEEIQFVGTISIHHVAIVQL